MEIQLNIKTYSEGIFRTGINSLQSEKQLRCYLQNRTEHRKFLLLMDLLYICCTYGFQGEENKVIRHVFQGAGVKGTFLSTAEGFLRLQTLTTLKSLSLTSTNTTTDPELSTQWKNLSACSNTIPPWTHKHWTGNMTSDILKNLTGGNLLWALSPRDTFAS